MNTNTHTNQLAARLRLKLTGSLTLKPVGTSKGSVLLSYTAFAFVKSNKTPETHTNYWECRQIAQTFLDLGYMVDIIDWTNSSFVPRKKYAFFVDIHSNMDRLAPLLNADCIKIFHATGAHWLFQSTAEYGRLLDIQKRRAVSLIPRRMAKPMFAVEHADAVSILGNEFTQSTYAYAKKPMHRIGISTTHTFLFPEHRDLGSARKNFVWFGGAGMVNKGLDLVLEAFAGMPDLHLSVCGPISSEKDFEKAYWKELYETANIKTYGKVDPGGSIFKEISEKSIAVVFASCSEGGGGSVITAVHTGLIPIVSRESSVDIGDFGILLPDSSIENIKKAAKEIAAAAPEKLSAMSKRAWNYVNLHHTREHFRKEYRTFIESLL